MKVVSVNIGVKTPIKVGDREAQTGIFKQPIDHEVEIKTLGITGDAVLDRKHHGGPDQAVYAYRVEDYDFWCNELGQTILPGTFGENLTLEGMPTPHLFIGDRIRFSQVVLEVTAPRIPCNILAARMGDSRFAKKFVAAERPGLYFRVIEPGLLKTGEAFLIDPTDRQSISTVQMFSDVKRKLDPATIARYLELPIDERSRKDFTQRLEQQS